MPNPSPLTTIGNYLAQVWPQIVLYAIVGAAIGWLRTKSQPTRNNRPFQAKRHKGNVKAQTQTVKQLEQRLIGLVHGDRYAVHRIMSNLRKNYPRKSAVWLYEKALHDLDRDRH